MSKIVITQKEGVFYYGLFQNENPLELYCDRIDRQSLLGDIYAARGERVADGLGAAFVELSDGKKAYLPLKKAEGAIRQGSMSSVSSDRLKGGDILLVQITKDAVKTKQAVADGNVSLDGKYLVLSLGDKRMGISRKISKEKERERLKDLLDQMKADLSSDSVDNPLLGAGIIMRTNSEGVSDQEILKEWKQILSRAQKLLRRFCTAPGHTLLAREPFYCEKLPREIPTAELEAVVTDDREIYRSLKELYQNDYEINSKIEFYEDSYPLYQLYRIEHFLKRATEKTVYLKSGGSLVIEPTEAMTVIDVNSGSVLKNKKKAQSIFYAMNMEAAEEIASQIRFRNLSGILMIDFINMSNHMQKEEVMDHLREACLSDRVPCRVVDMTRLGICEMPRSKVRKPLWEQIRDARNNRS